MLYHNYQPVPGIQGRGIELLLSLNIPSRFKDTEQVVPKMPSILISEEGFIDLSPNIVFTATLVVFYYAFYRCHVKVWCCAALGGSYGEYLIQASLQFFSAAWALTFAHFPTISCHPANPD